MRTSTLVPTESEFTEELGARLVSSDPADGYWCYELQDFRGITLLLSVNILERSLQTVLLLHGLEVQRTIHESSTRVWLDRQDDQTFVRAECETSSTVTTLAIQLRGAITVKWATLER
jgi:hypothetical protein